MKNMLIEIFKPTPIELTLEELEKKLYGRIIAGKTKENILNDLKLLELEGKIFYDARNNTYKTFPSNFFITKITSVKDNEFYFKINSKEYNLPNKNSLKKKDTIILEKVHNRFKFIKAIPNIEQEKSNDYDRIVDLFDAYNKSYSLHALAKIIKTDYTIIKERKNSLEYLLYLLVCNDEKILREVYEGDSLMEKMVDETKELTDNFDSLLYYDYDELKKQEAYELGEASGVEQGVEQNKVEVALNMLRENTNSDFICRVTGLSLDEVEKLRKEL